MKSIVHTATFVKRKCTAFCSIERDHELLELTENRITVEVYECVYCRVITKNEVLNCTIKFHAIKRTLES